jgi:putative transposase
MEIYHALNRGVDGRNIFLDDHDRARFVHNLFEFNDVQPALTARNVDLRSPHLKRDRRAGRELLVAIHGWTLMDNHYHLLLSGLIEGGLTLFLRKLNIGYAKYFNEKYSRSGTLFQSRTKRILIEQHAHFLYILHYLHLNPLDYLKSARLWRERSKSSIRDMHEALVYLDSYRWSSYLDYSGKKNFPSILTTSLFQEKPGDYEKDLRSYLRDAEGLPTPNLTLE